MAVLFRITEDLLDMADLGIPSRAGNEYDGGRPLEEGEAPPDPTGPCASFELLDDDGIVYYRGHAWFSTGDGLDIAAGDVPDETDLYAIFEWSCRDSGTVLLRFPGRPTWDIG